MMRTILTLLLCSLSTLAAEKTQPNILFIFADDIGYEALNSYGGLDFETPHLNVMAEQGLQFNRAYTTPVCTPSRVSMHTALYVPRHGHTGVLPVHKGTDKKVDFARLPTYAQLMRDNGYLTSVTGKWQLATLEVWPDHIRESGFDSWCVWQIWRDGKKTLRHWNPTFSRDGKVLCGVENRFGPDVLADYVIEQMTTAKESGKPFLIVHNELLPHWPVIDTPDDRDLRREPTLAGMIGYMDKLVGRLLGAVEDLGIRDNTYVIFMGDNGTWDDDFKNPKSGQPGEKPHTRHTTAGNVEGGKNQLNDAGAHVPLIVWGPKSVPQGEVSDDLVDVVDLFPTFCELGETEVPESLKIDGRSIVAQIHGKPGIQRDWVHQQLGHSGPSVFDGKWRYLKRGDVMLDARKLPIETPAAADDPEAAVAKERLKAILDGLTRD